MRKTLTAVFTSLVTLGLIGFSIPSMAQASKAETVKTEAEGRMVLVKEIYEACKRGAQGAPAKAGSAEKGPDGKPVTSSANSDQLAKCERDYIEGLKEASRGAPVEDSCKKAGEEFRKAQGVFRTACGKAGLSLDIGTTGFGCSTAANACNLGCETGTLEEDEELESLCEAEEDSDSKLSPDLQKLMAQYKTCAPKATEDLKDAEEKFEKKKDRIEGNQDKIREEEAALAELQLSAQAVMAKLDEKANTIEEELKERTRKAEEKLRAEKGALAEAIIKLENARMQAEGGIREVEIKEQNALVEKNKMIMDLKQTCLASALKALDDRRKLRAQQRATATYSAGEIKNLWSQVGTNLLQKDQRYVDGLSKSCEQGKAVQNSIKMINEMHDARKLGFIEEKRRHLANIQRADREITNLQSGQQNQAIAAYQTEVSDARAFALKQWNLLKAERERAMMALNNQVAQKQKEIQILRARTDEMGGQFEEAKQIYTMARKYGKSGRASKSGDGYDVAIAEHQNAVSAAEEVRGCCAESDFKNKPGNSALCTQAENALGESSTSDSDNVKIKGGTTN